ncbi:MAG: prolyl oligopeptidase family serine peptidase [Gemmatimonadales bacterium]|nr:prolyl oligopeptidase family serine peptidase [Candidatus Palauibacter irciniicola]MYC19367.1 prolyl oligopeptidase family serine peptidase [Gemmatimonadales bacterium]
MTWTLASRFRTFATLAALGGLAFGLPSSASSQERPLVTPDDYGRWERLGGVEFSPLGDWIAYEVTRVDETSELRVRRIDEDSARVFPWGSEPRFSPDGRWLAWTIGLPPEERERLAESDEPVREKASVMDLETGEIREFEAVSEGRFDASGRYVALRGYSPDEPSGKGADLRIVTLATGAETSFGNVSEMAWSPGGSLLALAIATGADVGNGVQVYDADAGILRSADASGSSYRSLRWRDDSVDLAALRSRQAASADGAAYDVLAWRGLDRGVETMVLGADAAGIPGTLEAVRHRAPAWSDDGRMISLGLRPIEPEAGDDADEGGADDEPEDGDPDGEDAPADDAEPDLPGLQIWHTSDVRLFPEQRVSEDRDAARSLLAVWHLDDDRAVVLGSDLMAGTQLLEGWEYALEDISEPYPWGAMFGRPYHDVWAIDADTGERRRLLTRVRYEWPSAGGDWLLSWDGSAYHSLHIATGERHDMTSALAAEFADTGYDTPTDVIPPHSFGPGGWLDGDGAVLLYDEHDIWRVAPDGSGGERLTRGAETGITHRLTRVTDDDAPGIDPDSRPYLSLHNDGTEQRGYARFAGGWANARGGDVAETLILEDARLAGLTRADSADVLLYRSERFDDPPDYFVAGPDLADPSQVTAINPFIDEVAWGRAELVDFTSESGRDLQFVLLLPANYEEGRAVPTIVYTYEILSPQMHFFRVPSERDYYNYTAWTQHGYAVLLPDIVYRARDPGVSALESVRAAVAKAVDMGVTDPDAVGLIGHSWGGYQATFLPTRTDIFAASVAGAPLTDFVSFMGQLHWNPGIAEVSHWETGQARMEVPFWEDPEAHRRNSPIHEVQNMETPLLMAFGNEDGVVDWDQGTEFFNFARRAEKQMVLLVYEGEDHGFREEANQKDYHRRILEWFGHYLKSEPAPAWITEGVALDALEEEKKRVAGKP